jgi:hypothetical protein
MIFSRFPAVALARRAFITWRNATLWRMHWRHFLHMGIVEIEGDGGRA